VRAGAAVSSRLRELAQRDGATMFMAVLAVLGIALGRATGKERFLVGSNGANRALPELGPVTGFFLTQIPFAIDLSGNPTFRELLGRVRRTAMAAYAHQNLPFSKLIEGLGAEDDGRRNPVVQVLLLLLQGESGAAAGDLSFEPVGLYDGNSRWDLMFGLYDYHDTGLTGPLEYNADIFDPPAVGRLLDLFYRLLGAVTADPDARLSDLPRLEDAG
jgi:non-ribosomal peptide synthetase component F